MRCFAILFALIIFANPAGAQSRTVLALGDSLTAGYGLPAGQAMPDVLQAALRDKGVDVTIINAGVSGDTAAQGAARFDWALTPDVKGLILELGANDALRGVQPEQTEKDLRGILDKARAKGLKVLILGMLAPPNLGQDYGARFNAIFPMLAADYGAALYPFYLDGVAAKPELNQPDGMHPNAKGLQEIVTRLLPTAKDFVESLP